MLPPPPQLVRVLVHQPVCARACVRGCEEARIPDSICHCAPRKQNLKLYVWTQPDGSEIDGFERRVKRRIAEKHRQGDIIAKGNDCLLTCDLVDRCSASDLAAELKISVDEAQCLKLPDSEWEKSIQSLFYRIHLEFGSHPVASKAIASIQQLVSCPKELQNISDDGLRTIPLAVRVWLEDEGVIVKDAKAARHAEQHSGFSADACPSDIGTHSEKDSVFSRPEATEVSSALSGPAKISDIQDHSNNDSMVQRLQTEDLAASALSIRGRVDAAASKLSGDGVDEFPDSENGPMDEEAATAILEGAIARILDKRNSCQQGQPDSVTEAETSPSEGCSDSLEWVVGQRVEICKSSGERHEGTVCFLSKEGHCICVMDDGSIECFLRDSNNKVRRIHGSEPTGTAHCLVAIILKAANGRKGIAERVNKYLKGFQRGSSAIEAVACASKVLQKQCKDLKFIEVLGEGGYGIVLSVSGRFGGKFVHAAVKMEVAKKYTDCTQSSLWREYNLLQSPPKDLKKFVPKLMSIFGHHSFIRVYSGYHTVSFLSMELLAPCATSILCNGTFWQQKRIIPDSFRYLALCQCLILDKARAHGISHGDIKNAHFMSRSDADGAGVVLVDWGLSERSEFDYTPTSEPHSVSHTPTVARLLYAPAEPQARHCGAACKPKLLRLGRDRPNTPGYRPQNKACSVVDRHQADVWALAVGWLEGVGLVPHLTGSAEQFEKDLYASRQNFEQFTRFIGKSINVEDSEFHPSVIIWLKLVYNVLQGGVSFLVSDLLKCNPALTQPFYVPSTLEKLRTTGIIVKGIKSDSGNTTDLKPILMMHLENVGLILLCLLFYRPEELLAYYGGQRVQKSSDETKLYPYHNLPIGDGEEIIGGVSKYFALEDFISFPAVGSFLKSSRDSPNVDQAGTLHKPERLKAVRHSKTMSTVPMYTRLVHVPGTQPDWSYNWNAGDGGAIFNEEEIRKMQMLANKPFPSHVWTAVADARAKVLREGQFKDADVSALGVMSLRPQGMPEEIYNVMCPASTTPAQPHTGGTSQCELRGPDTPTPHSQDTVQPLSPELVRLIEEAAAKCTGGKVRWQEWDLNDARTGATVLNGTEELKQHGFCVLDHVPQSKTKANQKALDACRDGGQGILFMDATGLALKSAERLKMVHGLENVLHARVFERPQQQCQSGVTSNTNASDESVVVDPASGGEACNGERPEVNSSKARGQSRGANESHFLSAWLIVVSTYISAIPEKAWSIIFQKLNGAEEERSGDRRRAELKGFKWVKPEKGEDEPADQFYDRMAGFFALKFFFHDLFEAITTILPLPADISSQLFDSMYSLLASDSTYGDVEAQSPHNDIKPESSKRRFSALINLSDLFSYLGILVNSCPNIKAMFDLEAAEFSRFQQQFSVTKSISQPEKLLSDVMGTGSTVAKVRFAWGHYFATNPPEQFKPMYPVYAKMPPVMVALFDTDTVHWGPPFPMPGIEYPIQDVRIVHYR